MNSAQSSEFQQQKEFYWKIRDELLDKYSCKWLSIAQNKIAAIAESPTDALRKAYEKTKAKVMYINKVGEEKKAMQKRIRRYNLEYDPALPMIDVLISRLDGIKEIKTEGIIDTGAGRYRACGRMAFRWRCEGFKRELCNVYNDKD